MRAEGRDPVFPPNPVPFVTDWLLEIGPTKADGMSESSIDWQDMAAWSRLTSIDLTPWEARTLRRMSKAFVRQRKEARKATCIEPRLQADQVSARKRVDDQFMAMRDAIQARRATTRKETT